MNTSASAANNWTAEARWLRWLTLLWLAVGLAMLFSASFPVASKITNNTDGLYFVKLQLIWLVLGWVGFMVLVRTPLKVWLRGSGFLYLLGLGLVLATHIPGLGVERLDATRWLDLGPITIQPSEFLKPVIVLQGAVVFGRWYGFSLGYRLGWVGLFALGLLGILLQPNLGTTAICGISLWMMAWVAGLPAQTLLGTAGAGLLAAGLSIAHNPYQLRRMVAFMDPFADPRGDGYQLVQSLLAIGSGGIWGRGYGLSQQKLFYLPIQYTDFIFSVYAEEFGLAGSFFFLLILVAFAVVGFRIMVQCRDLVHRLIIAGGLAFLVGQSLMNIGVVSGGLPTTGVPLPFFSHGGSALMAGLMVVGLMVRVAREAAPPETLVTVVPNP